MYANSKKSFKGCDTGGMGFVLSDEEKKLINDQKLSKYIFPLVNADNLLNSIDNKSEKLIINVSNLSLNELIELDELYNIIFKRVYPYRQTVKRDRNKKYWWIHNEARPGLYNSIKNLKQCIANGAVSKYVAFEFINTKTVFTNAINIFSFDGYKEFVLLSSTIHEIWANKLGSSLGQTNRYNPTDCFETFPLPQNEIKINLIDTIGEDYHNFRKEIMKKTILGLTKTYNLFHSKGFQASNLDIKDKQVIGLQKHLEITPNTISFEEAVQGIIKLRELHKEMDEAVLEAYGWQDIALRHDFYEVDYLPENDRVRFTIHPDARKEVLKRLLQLNHKIHEEEVAAGLWDKKKAVKKEKVVSKEILKEQKEINQVSLFDIENNIGMKEFSLNEGIYSVIDAATIIKQPVEKVRRWFKKLSEVDYEGLDGTGKIDIDKRRISFHGLIELVVIGTLLENGFTIKNIVKTRTDLKAKSGRDYYPFATNNVKEDLKVAGNSILFKFPHGTVTLDGTGQYNLEIIKQFFKDIVFENDIAMRIIPLTGKGEIIIDPKFAGGKPSFVKHNDLEVEMIIGFYENEDSIEELMENYSLSREEIEAALNYCS